jgi:hypothetical protein
MQQKREETWEKRKCGKGDKVEREEIKEKARNARK